MIAYEVWTEKGGDNFKGWNNDLLGTFKSEEKAEQYAKKNYGWVEEANSNYHPDFPFMDKEES